MVHLSGGWKLTDMFFFFFPPSLPPTLSHSFPASIPHLAIYFSTGPVPLLALGLRFKTGALSEWIRRDPRDVQRGPIDVSARQLVQAPCSLPFLSSLPGIVMLCVVCNDDCKLNCFALQCSTLPLSCMFVCVCFSSRISRLRIFS
jgi:hypothetical protein